MYIIYSKANTILKQGKTSSVVVLHTKIYGIIKYRTFQKKLQGILLQPQRERYNSLDKNKILIFRVEKEKIILNSLSTSSVLRYSQDTQAKK